MQYVGGTQFRKRLRVAETLGGLENYRLFGVVAKTLVIHKWGVNLINWVVVLKIFGIFTPKFGEMFQFDSYVSNGLKPPSS